MLFSALEARRLSALPVGNTPFYKVESMNIWIKNRCSQSQCSFKDRASTANGRGGKTGLRIGEIACASTGNAASSLAALAHPPNQGGDHLSENAPVGQAGSGKGAWSVSCTCDGTNDDAFKAAMVILSISRVLITTNTAIIRSPSRPEECRLGDISPKMAARVRIGSLSRSETE